MLPERQESCSDPPTSQAGEAWHLPHDWCVRVGPKAQSGGVEHLTPFKPNNRDWARFGVRAEWDVPARDVSAWLALATRIFEAGKRGLPEVVHDEQSFQASLEENLRSPEGLRGGQVAGYHRVWRAAHAAMGYPRHWREVLDWVRGFPGVFCHPQDPEKRSEPRHERRVRGVRMSLKQEGVSESEAEAMLTQASPPAMLFGNRFASREDEEFARAEIEMNVNRGSVLAWPFHGTKPWVVLPLAVAVNAEGKRRLILDARYINLWLQYLPFSFETITDLVRQGARGAFMTTWDLKAGYHHIPLASPLWPLLGLQIDGKFFAFACLPFGLSQAPYVFTRVMQCAHEWTRSQEHRLTAMVDDAATVHASREGAARSTGVTVWCEAALGFVHSTEKCRFWPTQSEQFLGFVVDWNTGQLWVPQKKLERLRGMMVRLQEEPNDAEMRSALGLLASCGPGLKLAPLVGRWLRQGAEYEREVSSSDVTALGFLVDNLDSLNGCQMRTEAPVLELNSEAALARKLPRSSAELLVLACDASDTAFGGFVSGLDQWWMVKDMSREEQAAGLSSTLREIMGFREAMRALAAEGRLHGGRKVQIWTDSQAAYACCVRMRGSGQIFQEVCELHRLAWRTDVQLSFVWVPREHEALRAADSLSKWQDKGDWAFSRTFAAQQLFPSMGEPDIDCLASSWASMCKRYYSAVYDGQCAAVDGLGQRWDQWPRRAPGKGKPLCWVFPPVAMSAEALLKIERERAEAIVVLPRQGHAAVAEILQRLPISAEVAITGPHWAMVRPTSRVPTQTAAGGWRMPLKAVRVHW